MVANQALQTFNLLPAELKERRQWVVWRREKRDGKETKVPYTVEGRRASSTKPSDWTDFATAVEAAEQFDGVGFVFSKDDPYTGIDLDHCATLRGSWRRWSMRIVRNLQSYAEYSVSGKGIHIIVKAQLPPGGKRRKGPVEMYDSGRYFCMSGNPLPGVPTRIAKRDKGLAQLYRETFHKTTKKPETAEQPTHKSNGQPTDDDIVRLLTSRDGARRLWEGVTHGYTSHSEADLALANHLAYYCGRDEERVDRLFRRSQLYREKWDREDYRDRVIGTAMEGRTSFHDWGKGIDTVLVQSLASLVQQFPSLKPVVIDGLLRRGELMNVIAPSKVGKSWLVMGLALSVANGQPWLGFPVEQGPVLILDNELHEETLAYRARAVSEAMELPLDQIDAITLRGRQVNYYDLDKVLAQLTRRYSIIVVDAHYRMSPNMSENDNAETMRTYSLLDRYAGETGAAWLPVHHASRGDQSDKAVTDVGAGAGSQSRAADTHMVLRPHEEKGLYVLEAVVRSFPPPEALVVRWQLPVWTVEEDADPKQLLSTARRRKLREEETKKDEILKAITKEALSCSAIAGAVGSGVPRVERLLTEMIGDGRVKKFKDKVSGNETDVFCVRTTR